MTDSPASALAEGCCGHLSGKPTDGSYSLSLSRALSPLSLNLKRKLTMQLCMSVFIHIFSISIP